jgi:hypothetical protein
MALSDAISQFASKSPAHKNRVELLIDKLGDSEDGKVLHAILRNPTLSGAVITKALRKEYGDTAVTDQSVGAWRRRNLSDVTGL